MNRSRPEIQAVLRRVRRWVRRYILLEGAALILAAACGLFWLTFGLDLLWFRVSQLELPIWVRTLCVVAGAALLGGMLLAWLFGRLFRRLRLADLALALERKFPELNDRLITAVELSGRQGSELHEEMFQRTAQEAAQRLAGLPVERTLDPRPLRRMGIIAGTLLVSILALGVVNAQAMQRWYDAYILGRADYWEPFRRNALQLTILAQPGDRVRQFNVEGVYRHPRGADLHLLGSVPDSAEPPERAELQFLTLGSGGRERGRISMSRLGPGNFQQTLTHVTQDHNLWIRAGDFTNRFPYRIEVVDPPRIEQIRLQCDYPSYTGLDAREDALLTVVGTQASLPMETRVVLHARVNKPLRRVHIRTESVDLVLGQEPGAAAPSRIPARLTIASAGAEPRSLTWEIPAEEFFSSDHRAFQLPLWISLNGAQALHELSPQAPLPLPLPPDETLRITLEDEDEIYSLEPASLTLNGIVDQPPVVDVRRTGVGTLVTRIARVPIEGRITDDYGVRQAWFGYRIEQAEQETRKDLDQQPQGLPEFTLRQPDGAAFEYFDLIPLNLQDGQSLVLGVYAEDGDTLNGPHAAHGELLTFKIVSREELLSRMFDREVNLRARFEQVRSEVADLRTSLLETRQRVEELSRSAAGEDAAAVAAWVDRSLHQIRKNHTESRSIEVSFRDLRDELVNNRIDTAEMRERLDRRIVEPMAVLNSQLFLEVDRRLGVLRLAVERKQEMVKTAEQVFPAVDQVLSQMDQILAEMKSRGTSNELIQDLTRLIEEQIKILEETENKRNQSDFFTPLK